MRKNKKVMYAAVSGCVILAGVAAAAGVNAGYPAASQTEGSEDTKKDAVAPLSGEMPPEPPSGSGKPPEGAPPDGMPPEGGQGAPGCWSKMAC